MGDRELTAPASPPLKVEAESIGGIEGTTKRIHPTRLGE